LTEVVEFIYPLHHRGVGAFSGGAKVPRSLSKDFVKHTFTIMQ